MDMVRNPDLLSSIKQVWLEDETFEKYGIEQEDYCQAEGIIANEQFNRVALK